MSPAGRGSGGAGRGRGAGGPGKGKGAASKGRGAAPAGRGAAPKGRGAAPTGRGGAPKSRSAATARGPRNPLGQMGPQARGPKQKATAGLGGEQVEGRQAVRELLLANCRDTREVWMASDLDPAPVLEDIRELAGEARVVVKEVGRNKLDAAARTDAPQGVIAYARPLPESSLADLLRPRPGHGAPFLLLCDGITDPGNLGALLRSAECAGVTGVVLPQHRAVHITPTVTKAAAGSIEHLPMAVVGGMPTAIRELRDAGVWVVGLDERGEKSLWDLDMGQVPVALVLGAEGAGLSRLVSERCDEVVAIPMRGRLSSLNVGTAGALACFEVARSRAR